MRSKLIKEFGKQTNISKYRLLDALKNRPLVYCGGGSTFETLRIRYAGYQDIKLISRKEWNLKSIIDVNEIINRNLCPILSTAYGLAISTENDNIEMKPFKDIFINIRGDGEEQKHNLERAHRSNFGYASDCFSYTDDWDSLK